jgi:hypothetical protein
MRSFFVVVSIMWILSVAYFCEGRTGPESLNFASPIQSLNLEGLNPMTRGSSRFTALMKSGAAVNASFPATNIRPKSVSEKVGSSLKKKTPPPLGDKKPNPDFFRKLQNGAMRASGDWQIEVAVPQRLSPTGLSLENGGTGDDADGVVEHHHGNGMEPILETSSPPLPNGFGGFVTPKDRSYKDRIETKAGTLEPVSCLKGIDGAKCV